MAASESGAVDAPLSDWMVRQRWFSGKGGRPQLRRMGSWTAPSVEDGAIAEVLLVEDEAAGTLYQVPLVRRSDAPADRSPIAEGDDRYDGPHDPAFVRALLELVVRGGEAAGPGATVVGEPAGPPVGRYRSSRVLSGEQSNTSIIIQTEDGDGRDSGPVIVKVFRALSPGDNPDVVLQTAIAAAGSDRVPRSLGALRGSWGEGLRGHFAFAQEFLPGTQDAWRVATSAVDADEDFTEAARKLGEATAEVHRILAEVLPTADADEGRKDALLQSMRSRLESAIEVVGGLEDRRSAIEAVFEAAAAEPWPRLQRVHGDYHLGQVLRVPERGWVLLDFEGEPLRPMEERSQPDLALRDVAGMLRSFDYAAGASRESHPGDAHAALTERWARDARAAFLEGYESGIGAPLLSRHPKLLAALELDKALYEAVYEARNRPGWLPIPAAAIARLAG